MFLHFGLTEDNAFFGVKASAHPVLDHLADVRADIGRVGVIAGEGVPVSHKKVGFFSVLQFHPVLQHAVVMAKVKTAGRAHTR